MAIFKEFCKSYYKKNDISYLKLHFYYKLVTIMSISLHYVYQIMSPFLSTIPVETVDNSVNNFIY